MSCPPFTGIFRLAVVFLAGFSLNSTTAGATFVDLGSCSGANACTITSSPPNPVAPNPNDGVLLAWNERQNIELTEDLRVDRVFDPTADFVRDAGGGDFFIEAGTIVSSHYLQWDPGQGSSTRISTTIGLDSQVFAFITADQNLFDSDALLGLPGLDYNDFGFRGLENSDTTTFNGEDVDIDWGAGSPGDWTRLITAFSPAAADPEPTNPIPEPSAAALFGFGLLAVGRALRRRSR